MLSRVDVLLETDIREFDSARCGLLSLVKDIGGATPDIEAKLGKMLTQSKRHSKDRALWHTTPVHAASRLRELFNGNQWPQMDD
jgi:hypothetical protein